METAKFLCEFFFDNFWHYLALLVLVCAMKPAFGNRVYNLFKSDKEEDED